MGQPSTATITPMYRPDIEAMTRHVEHLFAGAPAGMVELAWTDTSPDDSGRYRLRHAQLFSTDNLSDLVAEAARLNATPMCNVYIGAALRHPDTPPFGRAKDSDATILTAAYVDLDDPGAATAAKDVYKALKPTMVVVTGREPHTRAQLWWRLDEPMTDAAQWPELLKSMATAMGADTSVTNPSRVMRLAGTVAWPVKPGRTIEQTAIIPLREPGQSVYSVDALAAAFPAQSAPAATPAAPSAPKLAATLNAAKPASDRSTFFRQVNDLALRNAAAWVPTVFGGAAIFQTGTGAWRISSKELGRQLEEDLSIAPTGIVDFGVHDIGDARQGKRTPVDIVIEHGGAPDAKAAAFWLCEQIGAKPEAMGWRAAEEQSDPIVSSLAKPEGSVRFPFETIRDLRMLPEQTWLAKNWIPEGGTGIFYGKWAAGKSFIGFDLALHLAYGFSEWHGVALPGDPCFVLVLAREGHQGFVKRIDAFKKHHGITDDTDRIIFMRAAVSFMRDDEFSALVDAVKAQGMPFRLTLVDTVARVLPGVDMNEQQTITAFMERISILGAATGAATIGVHHQNKSGSMMGSVFFEANADFVFEVTRSGDEDGPLSAGEIKCTKQKDGEDGWKRSIRYKKVELSIVPEGPTSLVVEEIADARQGRAEPFWPDRTMCTRVINFIREAWDSGKPLSTALNTRGSGRYAPAVIANHFDLKAHVAEAMVKQWLNVRPQVLSVEILDKNSKQRGLKVVGSID